MSNLSLDLIHDANSFLQGKIRYTPLEFSPKLSDRLNVPIFLKLESFQLTGSFKIRGASFKLAQLTPKQCEQGIVTCSAGNHGLGVAYAAKKLGINVTIYVPQNVDQTKFEGMLGLGAKVTKSEFPGHDDVAELAHAYSAETGKPYIPSFDDYRIMAANGGTIATEILEDLPEARNFILPVGGGGLSAGFSFYVKAKLPKCKMIGCQLRDSPGLKLSLEQGQAVTKLPAIDTIAGGIEGGLGEMCFEILQDRMDHVALATEQDIIDGVKWMLENHQYLIEPSAAVTIATILNGTIGPLTGPTVILISGRNVSMKTINDIVKK